MEGGEGEGRGVLMGEISRSWRKERCGRHLSRARKRVVVLVISGGCGGRGGGEVGRANEEGSWARRESGTVEAGGRGAVEGSGSLEGWGTAGVRPESDSESRAISSSL